MESRRKGSRYIHLFLQNQVKSNVTRATKLIRKCIIAIFHDYYYCEDFYFSRLCPGIGKGAADPAEGPHLHDSRDVRIGAGIAHLLRDHRQRGSQQAVDQHLPFRKALEVPLAQDEERVPTSVPKRLRLSGMCGFPCLCFSLG